MVSFQQDLLLTINKSHEYYLDKINSVFDNENLLLDISIDDAEKLIEYIKEYKSLINSICLVIDKINTVKETNCLNNKIENELILKIIPIINVYRTLLNEKYYLNKNKSTIFDQD
jgi:hypothetical protein